MAFPKDLFRVTSHQPPRFQLYQPGFNPSNSCWLNGKWLTVPKAEYEKRKAKHQRIYKGLRDAVATQHHRNKRTALKDMTEAQRQAYEFFSGEETLTVKQADGYGLVSVEMGGTKVKPHCIEWIRAKGWKIPRLIVRDNGEKTYDQTRGRGIPDDLIEVTKKPVDTWKEIVKQNKENQRELSRGLLQSSLEEAQPPGMIMGCDFKTFALSMSMHGLLEMEEEIVRCEFNATKGKKDRLSDLEDERAEYVKLRGDLSKHPHFEEAYDHAKAEHNDCARANLDSSKGTLFDWVLPKFSPDGTHEPWGPKDVPWAAKDVW